MKLPEALISFARKSKWKAAATFKKIEVAFFSFDISRQKLIKKLPVENKNELKKFAQQRAQFFSFADRKEVRNYYQDKPERKKKIKAKADEICDHVFDLLGSGKKQLDSKINWHCDFKSGYCWDSNKFYSDIKYGEKEGVDVKAPWELSRFYHLISLGQAYYLTGNEKYTEEFISQVKDWIESNPYRYGVNWNSSMEVAIRACNWIVGFSFFKNSSRIDNDFLLEFIHSLQQHGQFIRNNLEKKPHSNNHYIANIVGLMYLGLFFKEIKLGQNWLNFSMEEIKSEILNQVNPDGTDYEDSTYYHKLVLELLLYPSLLLTQDGNSGKSYKKLEDILGQKYTNRLYKMFDVLRYVIKPNFKIPQIGDTDNGRLHVFKHRDPLDSKFLLDIGALFFEESNFKLEEEFNEELIWIFDQKQIGTWKNLDADDSIGSKSFPDGGWYVMRDKDNYCLISCGGETGGHSHNDELSFELYTDGEDKIVDPGTYVYTSSPRWRNEFRSVVMHNTVEIDGKEPSEFDLQRVFGFKSYAESECLKWSSDQDPVIFRGEHHGYERLSDPVVHCREIKYYKQREELEVVDRFSGSGVHKLTWSLICPPDLSQAPEITSDQLSWKEEEGIYSPRYGVKEEVFKLTSTIKTKIPFKAKFVIRL